MQQRLPSLSMQRLLRPGLLVHADLPVSEAIRRAGEVRAGGLVVVDSANNPQAIVDESRIGAIHRSGDRGFRSATCASIEPGPGARRRSHR